jgi:hypothetical protein
VFVVAKVVVEAQFLDSTDFQLCDCFLRPANLNPTARGNSLVVKENAHVDTQDVCDA